MSQALAVNEHYLNRVVALSDGPGVEAGEDIVSGTGMKLLAKGSRIDSRARERLLAHKLSKPLESMMRVVEGVGTRKIDRVAESLLERHPLLLQACGGHAGRQLIASLRNLVLTPPVDSLLSVYAAQSPAKLEHAVGIALLASAMAAEVTNSTATGELLLLAGLLHDVGEIYIDPAILAHGPALSPQQWKHIAAHPAIASRVLAAMPGAGIKIASTVQHHHERLDGFGYPQGLRGEHLPLPDQVLAMAELLMGLMESGDQTRERAAVAVKLIPGEFNRMLVDRITTAARATPDRSPPPGCESCGETVERLAARVTAVHDALQRFRRFRDTVQGQWTAGSPALMALLTHAMDRCQRINLAFTSTGLDLHGPETFAQRLAEFDAAVQLEVSIVVRELQWRLRELQREAASRAEHLAPAEAAWVQRFIEATQLHG